MLAGEANRRVRQPGSRRSRLHLGLLSALFLSLGLHLLVVPGVGLMDALGIASVKNARSGRSPAASFAAKKATAIELELHPLAKNEARRHDADKPEESMPDGQVVSLPLNEAADRPERAEYLAEQEQRAERETRARAQSAAGLNRTRAPQDGLVVRAATPSTSEARQPAPQDAAPGGPVGAGRATSGETGRDPDNGSGQRRLAFELPAVREQQRIAVPESDEGTLRNQPERSPVLGTGITARLSMGRILDEARLDGGGSERGAGAGQVGGAGFGDAVPGLAELTPSLPKLERLAGMPANDHLPDVETDAETRLNTFRWKHATFFNRIADSIRSQWNGGVVLSRSDPAGDVFGFEDRLTVVQVTLDKSGNIVDLAVAEGSGADPLDDEALRAFKRAGPFPNPPEALFEGSEKFSFLFGFNVTYSRTHFDLAWRPY